MTCGSSILTWWIHWDKTIHIWAEFFFVVSFEFLSEFVKSKKKEKKITNKNVASQEMCGLRQLIYKNEPIFSTSLAQSNLIITIR